MKCCALCGRGGVLGYERMLAAELAALAEPIYIGGEVVQPPLDLAPAVYLFVCRGRAACRRRRGLRP